MIKIMQQIMGITEDELQDYLLENGPIAFYYYDKIKDMLYFFNVNEEEYDSDREYQNVYGLVNIRV